MRDASPMVGRSETELRVGCSGWNYDSWRGSFYPEKMPKRLWLERYAESFDTVEINSTFYGTPKRKTVEHWAQQVPDNFLFACKMSRYVTHIKRLADSPAKNFKLEDGIKRFADTLEPLREAGKLGPILWQLPPTFKRDDARLAHALGLLPEGRHAFEFRHESWFTKPVYEALGDHDAALVIADDPESEFGERKLVSTWTYVRLHRGSRGRRGNYAPSEIETWRRRIGAWRSKSDVYAYFNNDWEAFAPRNALSLLGAR
jgi:uncharacterized protein YecE (DUF72 family)